MPRIAIVAAASKIEDLSIDGAQPVVKSYFTELQRLGYVEGKSLLVERYSALGRRDRFPEIARAAVESAPDLILTYTAALVQEISSLTTTIPILAGISDPVGLGLITNLARPERNITGVSSDIGFEIWGKRFQILREAVGRVTNVRFLVIETSSPSVKLSAGVLRQAAEDAGVPFEVAVIGDNIDRSAYERVFAAMARERTDGLVVGNSTDHYVNRALIVQLAASHRIPAIYFSSEFVEKG